MSFIEVTAYITPIDFLNVYQELLELDRVDFKVPEHGFDVKCINCKLSIWYSLLTEAFIIKKITAESLESFRNCHDFFDLSTNLLEKCTNVNVIVRVDIPICITNNVERAKKLLKKYIKMIDQISIDRNRPIYYVDANSILYLIMEFRLKREKLREAYNIIEKIYQDPRIVAEVI